MRFTVSILRQYTGLDKSAFRQLCIDAGVSLQLTGDAQGHYQPLSPRETAAILTELRRQQGERMSSGAPRT